MSIKRLFQTSIPAALALVLASCGGGTTDGSTSSGTEPNESAATGAPEAAVVSGRVADGYIQGATVCVDLNDSDSCDENEPSTVTGPGGAYDLSIPAGAEDKSIVADIPAEAIDEDTNEAVGKPLVFIAPADKPEFISPITTLVHQEIKSNPSLNVEDAENSVKAMLGVEQEGISLFDDYVAGGEDDGESNTDQDEFRYLHNTARVVASMMKDIQTQVESAAQTTGVDVTGSEDTKRAIRDIVRREVKELLPSIAQQVSEMVNSQASATAESDSGTSAGNSGVRPAFNPEEIALGLRPADVTDNIQERIDAAVERVEPVRSDIKQLLADGIYWLEFDCDYHIPGEPERTEEIRPDSSALDDLMSEENCEAFYGMVQTTDGSDVLLTQYFAFDKQTGTWTDESEFEDESSEFVLVNGVWQKSSSSGPQGTISFLSDGTAVISNDEGEMHLRAASENLETKKVLNHLLSDRSDAAWFDVVKDTDLFPSGSTAHTMSVKQSMSPYVMFNAQGYDENGESPCAQYYDNCNVLGSASNGDFYAMTSLLQIREAAPQSIHLTSLHKGVGPAASIKLMTDADHDGTTAQSGIVEWSFNYDQFYTTDGQTYDTDDSDYRLSGEGIDDTCIIAPHNSADEDQRIESTDEDQALRDKPIDICIDPATRPVDYPAPENTPDRPAFEERVLTSRWGLIDVDGVKMIEIQLPDSLRYDDEEVGKALLLIEQDGLVRLGARQSGSHIDRVVTYNETAFITLRSIIESGARRN